MISGLPQGQKTEKESNRKGCHQHKNQGEHKAHIKVGKDVVLNSSEKLGKREKFGPIMEDYSKWRDQHMKKHADQLPI